MNDRDSAFADYFAARSGAMRTTAYLLCGDWHRADDVVQAAFTKLYLAWNRVSRHEVLDLYVRRMVVNSFVDERRRAFWRRERLADPPDASAAPQVPVEDRVVLMRALADVPPRQRAVLVLRYWEDLSVEETAALLRCSPGTVKSQAARGLATLRTLLTPAINSDSEGTR
jgi:RNA polymerase sigma-70 factor (sigma-E family)